MKQNLNTGAKMGEIGETDNHLITDAQCLGQDDVGLFHLLKALIEDHVIEGFVRIFGQAVVDILMEDAQAPGNTFIDGLFVNLDALCFNLLFPDQQRQQLPVTAAQVENRDLLA